MATSDTELEAAVRDFTDIGENIVGESEFETVLDDAKRHVKLESNLKPAQINWYGSDAQEDALNWATKLFLKVAAGQLDSQTIQVGAIDHQTLLAKDGDEATIWYRRMNNAIGRINPLSSYGITSTERRTYDPEDDDASSGGFSL